MPETTVQIFMCGFISAMLIVLIAAKLIEMLSTKFPYATATHKQMQEIFKKIAERAAQNNKQEKS